MDGIVEANELDEYLALPIEKVREPLVWWWGHRHTFPQLSEMAFDYLSAPGMWYFLFSVSILIQFDVATSTAVKRVFSQGRQLLSYTRNRFSPSSIRSNICFGDWGRKDLVHMPDLVAALDGKLKKRVLEVTSSADEL